MKKVLVIIVSFNTCELTLKAIKSVLAERSGVVSQIVVVDNASTDSSVDEVRKLISENNKKIEITLLENKTNLGFAKANNQGLTLAHDRHVLLLNSDAHVASDTIGKLVEFANSTDEVGAVVPRLYNPDGSIQSSVFNFPTIWMAIKQYYLGLGKPLDKYYPNKGSATAIDVAVMAAFLITDKALKRVGELDERYFMYYEDFDYCRRIKQAGLKVYYLPEARAIHYHGKSGAETSSKSDQWRRLIPSSKLYHGRLAHYILNFILWSGQKFRGK